MPERLRKIVEGIREVSERYAPSELAIERVFVARNAESALKLGQARGAALVAVPHIPVFEYAATRVKQATTGSGKASKAQVQHMVRVLLSLSRGAPDRRGGRPRRRPLPRPQPGSAGADAAGAAPVIGRLEGVLRDRQPPRLLVDVGGVGYELEAPMTTFYSLPPVGESVVLHTHLAVRDEVPCLYGFARRVERDTFRRLLRVSGVGGKVALALLSGLDADGLARCVQAGDAAGLARIPGIGKKTAERLLFELRDRLPARGPGRWTCRRSRSPRPSPPSPRSASPRTRRSEGSRRSTRPVSTARRSFARPSRECVLMCRSRASGAPAGRSVRKFSFGMSNRPHEGVLSPRRPPPGVLSRQGTGADRPWRRNRMGLAGPGPDSRAGPE